MATSSEMTASLLRPEEATAAPTFDQRQPDALRGDVAGLDAHADAERPRAVATWASGSAK